MKNLPALLISATVVTVAGITLYGHHEEATQNSYWVDAMHSIGGMYADRSAAFNETQLRTTAGLGRASALLAATPARVDSTFDAFIAAGLGETFSLVERGGQIIAQAPKDATLDVEERTAALRVSQTGIAELVGPYRGAQRATMSVVSPAGRNRALVRRLTVAGTTYLGKSWWPKTAATSETFILRLRSDSVEAITPVRLPSADALSLRVAVSQLSPLWRAAMAQRDTAGRFVDARGQRVFASILAIPGQPWVLVAQIDESEAMADTRQLMASLTATVLALAALALVGWGMIRRTRKLRKMNLIAAEGARFASIVSNAMDAIVVTDDRGVIAELNPAAESLLATVRAKAIGKALVDVVRPDDPSTVSTVVEELSRTGAVCTPRELVRSGQVLELTASAAPDSGGSILFTLFLRDLTARRSLEAAVRRAEQLLVLGRLTGGIAHEFNNSLMAVSGFSEILNDEIEAAHPAQESVGQIRRASARLADVTAQLLSFGRQQVLRPAPVDLANLVDGVMSKVLDERRAAAGECEIRFDVRHADARGFVAVDPRFFADAVRELIDNSIAAMPHGGSIGLETGVVIGPAVDRVMLRVRDTGVGMSAETLAHATDPFFTTQSRAIAPGLGLAAVDGLVAQSGGRLRIESQTGKGTVVEIELPRVANVLVQPSVPPRRTDVSDASRKSLALVVDDDAGVRQVLVRQLAALGYEVAAAGSAREAEAYLHETQRIPALLVSDVLLPGVLGNELARSMRAQLPGLKTLLVSGYGGEELARRGIDVDALPLLEKPFGLEALRDVLRDVEAA